MLDALLIADNWQIFSLERDNEHKQEQTLSRGGGIFPFRTSGWRFAAAKFVSKVDIGLETHGAEMLGDIDTPEEHAEVQVYLFRNGSIGRFCIYSSA